MTVWDLDASKLPAGPVTTWPGVGVSLTSAFEGATADGTLVLPDPGTVDFPPRFTGTIPPFEVGDVIHAVVEYVGDGYLTDTVTLGPLRWLFSPSEVGFTNGAGFGSVPVGPGPAVVAIEQRATDVACYVNGVLLSAIAGAPSAETGLAVANNGPGMTARVYRVVATRGDVAANVATIAARYARAPIEITASATLAVSPSITVTTEDVWLPPEPPTLTGGGSVEPPVDPEPQDPPAKVRASRIRRVSEVMPAPTLVDGRPIGWKPTSVVTEDVGRLQIVVEGEDITYWGGVEVPHPTWSRVEPFGADQASIELPQITTFSTPGSGDLAWCQEGANVTIRLVHPDKSKTVLWRGVVTQAGVREDTGTYTLTCLGLLMTADLQLRTPPFVTAPMDAGRLIARALNSVTSRRYRKTANVVTGCKASVLGGWEFTLTGWITQVLATSIKNGRQWTVTCADRTPVIELKDTTTVHWTVRAGQRGVVVDVARDIMQATNVIYAEGIRPDGGRWRNAKYPNWRNDDTPAYDGPMDIGMRVGWSSPGVRVWQEKAGQPVTGTLSQSDRVAWRQIQTDAGIRVDDSLGPQTWAATFGTGSNTGSLDGAFIAPMAAVSQVRPELLGPDGDALGPNPGYDPDVLPIHRYVNFGAGVTKTEGHAAAREILARDADPGWAGTITLTMDPNEGSRYLIREGQNIRVRGVQGQSLLMHVARVEVSADAVTCTVDTKARDYPTLDAVLDREREAVDPARAYQKRPTSSTLASERATWDAESPGGRVPKHALFGGLWNVLRIPFSQYGDIVRSSLTTSGPASPFSVAVFDRPVKASQIVALVGNPLVASQNPWQEKADELDDLGLIMAWGWKEQPCGYYPRDYKNPDGETAAPVTGRFVDDASWQYGSQNPPWLWVAMIASSSCQIEGRFLHGVA